MSDSWTERLSSALDPLPDASGGSTIVLATAGTPPALALLSTGDVLIVGSIVRVGLWATSSAATRLGGAFSLLVPAGDVALRVGVGDARAQRHGYVAMIEGRLGDIRPTAEPPWVPVMRFVPDDPSDPRVATHLDYWVAVRHWLAGQGTPPDPPGPP
jgi:hypothetical protein